MWLIGVLESARGGDNSAYLGDLELWSHLAQRVREAAVDIVLEGSTQGRCELVKE